MMLALLIPDGTGVRNFLLGPFLPQAAARGSVVVLHEIPEDVLKGYASDNSAVRWQKLIRPRDRRVALVLRNALGFAHMYWGNTASMRYALGMRFGGSWRTRVAMRAAKLAGRLAATQRGIRRLDRLYTSVERRSAEVEQYCRIFESMKPSMLFCSNQRAAAVVPAVLAATKLGIPTVAFIFSWDNLTSKARNAASFDYYLVWSDLMRQELRHFYPDVPAERIVIVGTPQFDTYREKGLLWSRHEFFERIGADPSRKLICYSGGDCSIYRDEPEFVRILLEFVRAGRIEGRPQVMLRPCPVDEGSRYAGVRASYPELIYRQPMWVHTNPGNWACSLPDRSDVQFLANLTHHADINVNLASTMTLDFAIHDKPVVNVAFDPASPPPLGIPLADFYYRFEHYRPVVELGAARIARTRQELADHVNAYLGDPTLDREKRRRFVELEVGGSIGDAGARIMDVLVQIAQKRSLSSVAIPQAAPLTTCAE